MAAINALTLHRLLSVDFSPLMDRPHFWQALYLFNELCEQRRGIVPSPSESDLVMCKRPSAQQRFAFTNKQVHNPASLTYSDRRNQAPVVIPGMVVLSFCRRFSTA